MARTITHNTIVTYFNDIATSHNDLKDFFRLNISEIQGAFRTGVLTPVLALESHEGDIGGSASTSHNRRTLAFSVLEPTGIDDYDEQNAVLDRSEQIGLDIISKLVKDSQDPNHWLYGRFKKDSVNYHKVGPIYSDYLFGYRFELAISNPENLTLDPTKWS